MLSCIGLTFKRESSLPSDYFFFMGEKDKLGIVQNNQKTTTILIYLKYSLNIFKTINASQFNLPHDS